MEGNEEQQIADSRKNSLVHGLLSPFRFQKFEPLEKHAKTWLGIIITIIIVTALLLAAYLGTRDADASSRLSPRRHLERGNRESIRFVRAHRDGHIGGRG